MSASPLPSSLDVAVVGGPCSGKTSLVQRFVAEKWVGDDVVAPGDGETMSKSAEDQHTSGATYYCRTMDDGDGPDVHTIKFQIWDTSSDVSAARHLLPIFYKSVTAAVVLFDVTNMESFSQAKEIVDSLKVYPNIVAMALVGTKVDAAAQQRCVPRDVAESFACYHDMLFEECSALRNTNVTAVFTKLADQVAYAIKAAEGMGMPLGESPSAWSTWPLPEDPFSAITIQPSGHAAAGSGRASPPQRRHHRHDCQPQQQPGRPPSTPSRHGQGSQGAVLMGDTTRSPKHPSDVPPPTVVSPGRGTQEPQRSRTAPHWQDDSEVHKCEACSNPFTLVRRRHHCRSCGKIFCADCSSHKAVVPFLHTKSPVRVCDVCYRRVHLGLKDDAQ